MTAIFKREFRSFFHGMLGYVLTAFLVASSGLYFLARCLIYGLTDFSYYTLYQTIFMLLLYIPVLAMRSLAEERHSRTDQLLLTSPVSVWGIVLGKFFAMAAVFALPCAVDAVMIFILWALGGTVSALLANLAGLLCYFLLGCAAIALCEFLSGLTDFSYYTLYQTIFMLLLYIPVLAMRSLAEERHSRTDQLLLTSPVSVWGIVLGKFFAMAAVFALPCAVDAVMIFILWALGGTVSALLANLAGLLCYFLLGCAAIALCEFLSGLTENQIIAAVAGFSALLLAYLMPSLRSMFNAGSAVALAVFTGIAGAASLAAGLRTRSFVLGCLTFAALCLGLTGLFLLRSAWLTEAFSAVLSALCLFTPFEDFVNNSFSIPAVVYYLTVTAVFLFFTAQDIEKRRWN